MAGCSSPLTTYVNPFVGTDGHGHTFPGAIVPFGMIQPGPDTRQNGWDGCSGYHYSDDTLYGFSHTHLSGTGCEDYGDVMLMPVCDGTNEMLEEGRNKYLSTFSHKNEEAHPGYYSVKLDRDETVVELSCTERVAYHRYTFNRKGHHAVVIDLTHRDVLLEGKMEYNEGILVGLRRSSAWNPDQKCFFAIEGPFKSIEFSSDSTRAFLWLDENEQKAELRVAISAVDEAGALKNLRSEKVEPFDSIRDRADRQWETQLEKLTLKGGTAEQRKVFYTALYHCCTSPYLFSDVDGRYRGTDDQIHQAPEGRNIYTVFSLWDTYRTLHPLLILLEPERTKDFIYTFLTHYRNGGELTMWELAGHETHCMIGYHAAPVILDAYLAGLVEDSLQRPLLEAMIATSNRTEAHRNYAIQGYLSSEIDNESVSKTLEYAYDDWCIARYATALGDTTTANIYNRRAQSWKNLMDENGFMHPKRNGAFVTPFDPTEVNNHFTEANSWQYSSYVPHDVSGWAEALGGRDHALQFLDSLFFSTTQLSGRNQADITGLVGIYAHGNEPSHHAAYFYAQLGHQEKCEALVHHILENLYSSQPDGLCGNEDCGQMSAWYVMSSLGYYPLHCGEWVKVKPLLRLKNNRVLEKIHNTTFRTPHTNFSSTPYFSRWEERFEGRDTLTISVNRTPQEMEIYYTLDGSIPTKESTRYTNPIVVDKDCTVKAVAYTPKGGYSGVVAHKMTLFKADKKISYITKPAPQYYENGAEGLVDRIYGTNNFRIGGWQGWTEDCVVEIDLLEEKSIKKVTAHCLQDMKAWIFFPRNIEVEISHDGKNYTSFAKDGADLSCCSSENQNKSQIQEVVAKGNAKGRYVRVTLKNYGKLPSWHASSGESAWLFVDEITVE